MTHAVYERIRETFGELAFPMAPMSERTTFRVGGPADMLVTPRTHENLSRLMAMLAPEHVPVFIFSGGSNLLVRDGGIRGVVIDMSRGFDELDFEELPDGHVHIHTGASRKVSEVVEACAERGLSGLEWAAGIPGTVGGGIRGNAGTRDGDFASTLVWVEIVDREGTFTRIPRADIPFRYRGMALPGRFIITAGLLRVRPGDAAGIRKKIDDMIAWRYQRQPYEAASAGSIFKNPDHAPAGRLIDQAGLKGTKIGGAMISDVHTNFIVNTGGARSRDIVALIEHARRVVYEKHGVQLDTEVVIVGEEADDAG
ncbi:UDP-N-acetylmuramate dehydrogenase [bacterium]|nr:UDP-N-acetylmuramate dehydrogenase [bacterium]